MPTVIVAAITTTVRQGSSIAVTLPAGQPLKRESQIMAFQVMTVDQSRLGNYAGCLDQAQIADLEKAMRLAWGL